MSIRVSQLAKQYGTQKAVDQISFTVGKGEIVGFLGPNGAGKSTTMKMITGYLQPDSGSVEVCGLTVSKDSLSVKKKIGYLPESNPLYNDLYVREYLAFVADLHELDNRVAAVEKVVQLVGLTPESHKKIGQLSKGYKQRVGLAAALIHDPEVLILDEPTTGLDPNQIAEIRQVISTLGKEKTILFSTHIMQEVEAICDRVVIINKGKVIADDTLAQLRQQQESADARIIVSFKEPLEAAWLERLPAVKSVVKVTTYEWEVISADANLAKKQIFEMALENHLNIVSLHAGAQRLEEVFRALTNQT
jgi:ABC-2 type transport system ATP-binding protein